MSGIIVYVDQGVDGGALKHVMKSLQQEVDTLVHPIKRMDAEGLKKGGWEQEAAVLVIPGGRDVYYHRALQGEGTKRIRAFVEKGGRYLGICAGAYFGSDAIEFEKGSGLEVCAKRSLEFFPGLAKGPAYGLNKYSYESCRGVEAALISWTDSQCRSYYNGGCAFEKAEQYDNVEVLGRYLNLEGSPAAIINCKVGKGMALLSGVHIEYSSLLLSRTDPYIERIITLLLSGEEKRRQVFQEMLLRLGLTLKSHLEK